MTDTAATSPPEQDVHCPLCDYDLRGLTEARCPECGAPFDWDELRDPTRRKHPYLFEHHPERNLWSWFRTLIGGLLPRRFWKTLSPVQPSKPRRLLLYWILCLLAGSVGLFAELGRNYLSIYHAIGDNRTGMQRYFYGPGVPTPRGLVRATPAEIASITKQYGSVQQYIDQRAPKLLSTQVLWAALGFGELIPGTARSRRPQDTLIIANLIGLTAMVLWPFEAMLVMLIFRASMKRASVRPIHLLRVAIYCGDIVVWIGVAWFLVAVILFAQASLRTNSPSWMLMTEIEPLLTVIPMIGIALLAYRLGCAMGRYLRFRHALAMAISVQLIIVLATFAVLAQLQN